MQARCTSCSSPFKRTGLISAQLVTSTSPARKGRATIPRTNMDRLAFGAALEMHPPAKVQMPSAARTHSRGPSIEELDSIQLADYGHAMSPTEPQTPMSASKGYFTPTTPNELEASRPPTPKRATAASALPTFWYPRMNKWRILCSCLIYFGNGMSDSAPGALIPYIEEYYHIGYAIVSMIWIANAVGFISSAFLTDWILSHFGRAKTLMIAEAFMIGAYVVIACAPPFPVVAVAYLFMVSEIRQRVLHCNHLTDCAPNRASAMRSTSPSIMYSVQILPTLQSSLALLTAHMASAV